MKMLLTVFFTIGFVASKPVFSTILDEASIKTILTDFCEGEVVVLGEDPSHGSAKATIVRTQISEALIKQCGFSAVFFEAQVYDFIYFNSLNSDNSQRRDALARALGGFLYKTKEVELLLDLLIEYNREKQLLIGGIDVQVHGAVNSFTQNQLAKIISELTSFSEKERCHENFKRYINWEFNETYVYQKGIFAPMQKCLEIAMSSLKEREKQTLNFKKQELMLMFKSFSMLISHYGEMNFNQRSKVMADLFMSQTKGSHKSRKSIIWAANVHSAKLPVGEKVSMTSLLQKMGAEVRALGITSYSGEIRMPNKSIVSITPAVNASLEAYAVNKEQPYISKNVLKKVGNTSGRLFGIFEESIEDWANYFDGVFVVESDEPLENI